MPTSSVRSIRCSADHAVVQLPVLPLIAADSRWVSAHYADEFAWAHSRTMPVREQLGAGMPLAGVGCAIRRDALQQIAARRGGQPFDPESITEDYELGLALGELGAPSCFARVTDDARAVDLRAVLFPVRVRRGGAAEGALDRGDRACSAGTGWAGADRCGSANYWMRMRDRRGPVAMMVLAAAYLAAVLGALAVVAHLVTGTAAATLSPTLAWLVTINTSLLVWRLATRGWTTGQVYGWREGVRAVPRAVVGNVIALRATYAALGFYAHVLRGRPPAWDKTAHVFPEPGRGVMQGRPLRFLGVLGSCWIGARVVLLWPAAEAVLVDLHGPLVRTAAAATRDTEPHVASGGSIPFPRHETRSLPARQRPAARERRWR